MWIPGRSARRRLSTTAGALVPVLAAARAGAQGKGEEPRIALVIGNGACPEVSLRNPADDARETARSLPDGPFAPPAVARFAGPWSLAIGCPVAATGDLTFVEP